MKQKKYNIKKYISLKMPAKFDWPIYIATMALYLFGTVMVISASMGLAIGDNMYLLKIGIKQLVFGIIGYIFMTMAARNFKLSSLKSDTFIWFIIAEYFALLACLVFPGANGAKAWLRIPLGGMEFTIQPSEFAKILAGLIIAHYLGDNHKKYKATWNMLKRPLIIIGSFCAIILVLQSDFGSSLVVFLIACSVFLIPNNERMKPWQRILRILFYGSIILGFIVLYTPVGEGIVNMLPNGYQKNRFLDFFNPFLDQYGSGYQLVYGLISFASGGLKGRGFGNSLRKYMSFPAANTDYILAIIVEELGFIGFLFLMFLYAVIIFRCLYFARKIKSEKAKIILACTSLYFLIHIFFNMGGVTGSIPLTGIPLLMVSSGGSSMVGAMLSIGLAQAIITRYNRGEIQ